MCLDIHWLIPRSGWSHCSRDSVNGHRRLGLPFQTTYVAELRPVEAAMLLGVDSSAILQIAWASAEQNAATALYTYLEKLQG